MHWQIQKCLSFFEEREKNINFRSIHNNKLYQIPSNLKQID